ncbi:hypothetical protein PI124_g9341 [Phytophthora idaei]|nr:hypothetical protein PI125_g9015 [Phytophthora idaei]KAG3157971.1 hypothetical protein PI126_g8074 [Phytophthora idaei]KAG3245937.1 hypothetical protein PI124_g9341 [Phytophthora idaei]
MNEIGDDEANEDDSDSTTDNAAPAEGRKRPESALTGNVAKRERLAVVMDSLTDSLKSTSEEDSHKYEYRSQRLAFDKEQAELKRQHDAVEAEKMSQHEYELETQRQQADEEREKRMFEFFRTMLMQKPTKE